MLLVEFTIEPFHDGQPGPHVLAAVAAAEAAGVSVDFGPFGSTCIVDREHLATVSGAVIDAAFAHGATHVSLHVAQLASEGGR